MCKLAMGRSMRSVLAVSGLVLVVGAWSPLASAQEGGESIDDLLGIPDTDGAKPDQPDPLDDPKPAGNDPGAASSDPAADADPAPTELRDDLERQLDGQAAADVFAKAQEGMQDVARRLGEKHDGGLGTLREQDMILARLDQVILSAKKQQQQGGGGKGEPQDGESSPSQGKPKGKPGEGQGQGEGQKPGEGDNPQPGEGGQESAQMAEDNGEGQPQQGGGSQSSQGGPSAGQVAADGSGVSMRDLRDGEWGNLPPRLRHELTEGIDEVFSPVYRRQTEAYYRRIAEALRSQDD